MMTICSSHSHKLETSGAPNCGNVLVTSLAHTLPGLPRHKSAYPQLRVTYLPYTREHVVAHSKWVSIGSWPAHSHNLVLHLFPTCGNGWNKWSSFLVEVWQPTKFEPALRKIEPLMSKICPQVTYNKMGFEMRRIKLNRVIFALFLNVVQYFVLILYYKVWYMQAVQLQCYELNWRGKDRKHTPGWIMWLGSNGRDKNKKT